MLGMQNKQQMSFRNVVHEIVDPAQERGEKNVLENNKCMRMMDRHPTLEKK